MRRIITIFAALSLMLLALPAIAEREAPATAEREAPAAEAPAEEAPVEEAPVEEAPAEEAAAEEAAAEEAAEEAPAEEAPAEEAPASEKDKDKEREKERDRPSAVGVFELSLDPIADNNPYSTGGKVRLTALSNGDINVKVHAWGTAPSLVHALHIHAIADGSGGFVTGTCPTIAADGVLDQPLDGLINTVEGIPAYGVIVQSLTTVGDTSAASGLAVDRFPVSNSTGWLEYNRTFTPTDPGVWEDLGNVQVVLHGIDLNENGVYDFEAAGASELDPAIPQEATIPSLCAAPRH